MRTHMAMPRSSDRIFRLAVTITVALASAVILVPCAWVRNPLSGSVGAARAQPVEFDHRHHVRDDGIDCEYCHYDVRRSSVAGVPDTALCMGCHAQVWNDSPLLEPVRQSARADQPIYWRRVHILPDFVFFDHSAHVERGVGCESCHGRVDLMALVAKARLWNMQECIECHRDPVPHLRPPERATEMGLELSMRERRAVADRLHVDPPLYCSGCHR